MQARAGDLADGVQPGARSSGRAGRRRSRPSCSGRPARPGSARAWGPGRPRAAPRRRWGSAPGRSRACPARPSCAPVSRRRAWIARETSSRGASSSTKRSPVRIVQRRALAADRLGHEEALAPGHADHGGGVELQQLEVGQPRARGVREQQPDALRAGWVGRARPQRRGAAGREHDRACGHAPRRHRVSMPAALPQQHARGNDRAPSHSSARQRIAPPARRRLRSVHSARARALEHCMRGSAGRQRRQLATTRRPVALPPAWTMRRTECPPSRPEREPPEAVGVEAHPERLQVATHSGASCTRISAAERLTSSRPARSVSARWQLGAVVGRERGGEAALRPVARRLRQRRGRDEHHPRALAGGAQRRVQAGRARADDRDVGLCGRAGMSGSSRSGWRLFGTWRKAGFAQRFFSRGLTGSFRLLVVGVVAVVVVGLAARRCRRRAGGDRRRRAGGDRRVPGVTAPAVVGATAAAETRRAGGARRRGRECATAVGAGAATVIVLVTGGGVVAVLEPPLSLTSAAASTPSESTAITAIATIGALQFGGAARRVRAAAPQLRHHSCSGSSGAPHSGQAASTGGVGLAPGVGGRSSSSAAGWRRSRVLAGGRTISVGWSTFGRWSFAAAGLSPTVGAGPAGALVTGGAAGAGVAGAGAGAGVGAGVGVCFGDGAGGGVAIGAGAGVGVGVGAGAWAALWGPAIGRSARRSIARPQLGQKRSSLPWIAAQRGHAVTPASRRTVTAWRSARLASSARSSASMCPIVSSLASTSVVVALAEAVQVEHEPAEVAVGQLARLAQEPRAPAHAPALAEPGRSRSGVLAGRASPRASPGRCRGTAGRRALGRARGAVSLAGESPSGVCGAAAAGAAEV